MRIPAHPLSDLARRTIRVAYREDTSVLAATLRAEGFAPGVQVLHRRGANPSPPIAPWTVPLRQLKAWFAYRAWAGPAEFIRWQGACGRFEGPADLPPR